MMDIVAEMLMQTDTEEDEEDFIETSDKPFNIRYQYQCKYINLLPYADELDKESNNLLADIKGQLGRSIMLRQFTECKVAVMKLNMYIKLYFYKFTKDDHILLIKLLFELVTIPDLEPRSVTLFANALGTLLKKTELISPKDLELPWRPLYELYKRSVYRYSGPHKAIGMEQYFPAFVSSKIMSLMTHQAKIYFPVSATQEILDELRPQMHLLDVIVMERVIKYLENFLPIRLFPEDNQHGFKLWFEEFMKLWEVYHNPHGWENTMMELMSQLAWHNIGYIDWEPYIPIMFTRFLRNLLLPVVYKKSGRSKSNLSMVPVATWIVSILGNNSSGQIHLEKLLKTIETYLHQANIGPWVEKLKDLLGKLASQFVLRLHKERYKKPSWEPTIPDSHKLKDEDIDAFVKCMMPVAMTAMFGLTSLPMTCKVIRNLAAIRPNIVIPPILDRFYATLDSLTEPHKMTAAMLSLTAFTRPLVQGKRNINTNYTFNDGPSRVIPLLFSCLPGIDANDSRKSSVTFRLILFYVTSIPLVDCSKSIGSELLDEDDKIVCEETSQFEDFVLQFLDRVFSLIESNTLEYVSHENENIRGDNPSESMLENYLFCTIYLLRVNDNTFKTALNKLKNFLIERVFETKVSGRLAGALCYAFSKVNPKETLKVLIPPISQMIFDFLDEGDIAKEERSDDRLLYPLLLTFNMVSMCRLSEIDTITEILDKTLHLKSIEASTMASKILGDLLQSLSNTTVLNYTYNGRDYNDPNYPYIFDWGQGADINALKINWYTPGDKEIDVMQSLFNKYVPPEIEKIQDYCNNENSSLTRQDLLTSLNIVYEVIDGCGDYLQFPSDAVNESGISKKLVVYVGVKREIKMPDGSNVFKFMAQLMTQLQSTLLKKSEDDTKSIFVLLKIWNVLLLGKFYSSGAYKKRWLHWKHGKVELKDELVGNRKVLPELLVDRINLQHECRVNSRIFDFTNYHKHIMYQLLELATSRYANVRSNAQDRIFGSLLYFPYSRLELKPFLLEILAKDPEDNHEAHKGLLYLLLGPRSNPLIVSHDWSFIRDVWPALVASKPSEKMSAIRLKNSIINTVDSNISTISIKINIPDKCVEVASKLWDSNPKVLVPMPNDDEIKIGIENLQKLEIENSNYYENILNDILTAIESNCHWRQRYMGMKLIKNLAHLDRPYPDKVIKYFSYGLIHDSLEERKIATVVMVCILRQQKRKHPKIIINPPDVIKSEDNKQAEKMIWSDENLMPGIRSDNLWLQYNYETRPLTEKQWDENRYVCDTQLGYYTWPKEIKVYAPSSQQPNLNPQQWEMTQSEKLIDSFFNDPQNIEKLINFNSIEERKGKDKLIIIRYHLYKGLFRNYGIRHLHLFIPHLKTLVKQEQESSQRCAAEIIAGIIKGSKHWPFSMVNQMWQELIPIIKTALEKVTVETVRDWSLCFALALLHRDPNKSHWLLECLMEEPKYPDATTSFLDCHRLYILQSALGTQTWRIMEILDRLLKRIERKLLGDPFQNVRNILGLVLTLIFIADYNSGTVEPSLPSLKARDLIERLMPRLEKLEVDVTNNHNGDIDEVRAKDMNLLKTVCKWLMNTIVLTQTGLIPSFIKLLPILCQLESCETDDEMRKICKDALSSFAGALILPRDIETMLDQLECISNATSWSTRESCVSFIEVFVFNNMGLLVVNPVWVDRIKDIVLKLLADERLEVREKAGQVLCGLLHCSFLPEQDTLLNEFKKKSKIKIKNPDDLRLRHAGVLGLCAFIQAHPYDVPKYVPSIFEYLNLRLNDPQPVPTTIRKTLGNFKRTHYDGWTSHAQCFTEEQLAILEDLTVPPSYYA